jgi:hypothetical protein
LTAIVCLILASDSRYDKARRQAVQSAIVIDDAGEISRPGAPRLAAAATRPPFDDDAIAYAVYHLGYVVLRRQGRLLRAEMRPVLVKPVTLIALYYTLAELKPQRILLLRLGEAGVAHELFDDVAEFAATIERYIADDGIEYHRPAYALLRRTLQQLGRARFSRFAVILARWRAARGDLPRDLLSELNGHGLATRASLLRSSARAGRLFYEHVGSGYSFVGKACLPLTLIGKDIEQLPDPEYAFWAARSYHQCLAEQEPRFETVSAVMRRADGQRLWSYYDRLLLPWRAGDGTRYMLGLSAVRRRMLVA